MSRTPKVYTFKLPKIDERTGLPTSKTKLHRVTGKQAKTLIDRFSHCGKKRSASMVSLPAFNLLNPNRDPPHRHRVEAERIIEGIRYRVASNWPRTRWWLTASRVGGGFFSRCSNGLTTGSKRRSKEWIRAVRAGEVQISRPGSLGAVLGFRR